VFVVLLGIIDPYLLFSYLQKGEFCMFVKSVKKVIGASAVISFIIVGSVQAKPLGGLIPGLLESHDKIKAAHDDVESEKYGLEASEGAWMPTLDLNLEYGHEIKKKVASETEYGDAFQRKVTLKQLITDFGKTSSDIRKAELDLDTKNIDLESAKQKVLLDGVKAYVNLLSAMEELKDARRSESNIKKQTGMEQARVKVGSGYSTDVLRSKGNLAGANSKTVTKQGDLVKAQNKFRAVFGDIKLDLKKLKKPAAPYRYMPRTLAESIQVAKENNATLLKAKITKDKAIQDIKSKKATLWGPTAELKVEYKDKNNWGGTAGREEETLSVVEVKFPLFAGGKNNADYRGAQHDRSAAHSKYLDSLRTVEEKVRNAWQKVSTSKATAGFKRNQANIDTEFLRLARKERKLGKRSLQDILSAENDYISSLGAAVKAEKDMQLAAYELFETMGVLDTSIILGTKTARVAIEKKVESAPEEAPKPVEKEGSTFKDNAHNWNNVSEIQPSTPVKSEVVEVVVKQEKLDLNEIARGGKKKPVVNSLNTSINQIKEKSTSIVDSFKNVLSELTSKTATVTKKVVSKDVGFKSSVHNWN